MYGSSMGTLTVKYSSDGSSWTTFVTKSSNQGEHRVVGGGAGFGSEITVEWAQA